MAANSAAVMVPSGLNCPLPVPFIIPASDTSSTKGRAQWVSETSENVAAQAGTASPRLSARARNRVRSFFMRENLHYV